MWFKQLQFFLLPNDTWDLETLESQLEALAFQPCLPHVFSTAGWVAPYGDDEASPLIYSIPDYHMICCQFDEKILPTTVIQQTLQEKIKEITDGDNANKIPTKEKIQLKEVIIQSLLPRAFTKKTRIYAYIDIKNNFLLMNTINIKKTEQVIALLQRTIGQKIMTPDHKKIAPILTQWLVNNKCPSAFHIENFCLLQDPQQQHRLIRCQEQDLFSKNIQALVRDRCEVTQLALSWQGQAHFVLADDFTLRSLHFDDKVISAAKEEFAEAAAMQFQVDFTIMAGILSQLVTKLWKAFGKSKKVGVPYSTSEKLEIA